jgi:tetratricopeptide (TPR) repeat protein
MKKHLNTWLSTLLLGLFMAGCNMEVPEQVYIDGVKALENDRNFIYALVQFDKFLAKYPEHEYVPEVMVRKAQCHVALGEVQEALEALDQVIARFSNTNWDLQAHYMKADLYERQGQPEKAIELLVKQQKKLEPFPRYYHESSMQLAQTYSRNEEWIEAAGVYGELIESASLPVQVKPPLYIMQGQALSQAGEKEQAEEVFLQLIETYPETNERWWAEVELARLNHPEDPEAALGAVEEVLVRARQKAAEMVAAATAEAAQATGELTTEGFMAPRPPQSPDAPSLEDQMKLNNLLLAASAYAYLGNFDLAIETLEDSRNDYLQVPQIHQLINQRIEQIRFQKQREESINDSEEQAALSVGSATVGVVPPGRSVPVESQ